MDRRTLPIELQELADLLGLPFEGDPKVKIEGFESLDAASSVHASYCLQGQERALKTTAAGVVFLSTAMGSGQGKNAIFCENPEESFCRAIELLGKDEMIEEMESCCIHPTAQIDSTAFLGKGVRIGPGVVVGPHVRIGSHTILLPGVVIGHEVEIGENCQLHPNCVIYRRCRMGSRVVIGANAVIGGIGFGLQKTDQGFKRHKHYGAVEIADDVEIGANTTIDRARWGMTRIGRGTKIDNQVQIAHNVQIGNHNAIAAQTGIAGSSRTGSWVICGGKSAVNDHIEITSGVVLAACSAVSKSIKEPGVYSGLPVSPVHEHNRRHALLKNIHKLVERVKKLEEIQCSEVNK